MRAADPVWPWMGRVTSGPEDWLHTHNLNPVDKNIIITNWSDIYSSADLQLLEDVWIHCAWHHLDHMPGIIQTVSPASVLLAPNVLYLLFPSHCTVWCLLIKLGWPWPCAWPTVPTGCPGYYLFIWSVLILGRHYNHWSRHYTHDRHKVRTAVSSEH